MPPFTGTVAGTASRRASTRGRIVTMYAALTLINLVTWGWACVAVRASPMLFGTAFLAYSFGLRHAMDADQAARVTS